MHTRSIRFRLTVWYAVALTAALGLFGTLVWLSLRHQLIADFDDDLAGRASRFEGYFRQESSTAGTQLRDELEEFCQALPPASYVYLRGARGFVFRYPQDPVPPGTPMRMLQRSFALNGESFDLEAGAPVTEVRHALQLLRLLLAGFIPVVILLACTGGWWLSGRALKPVQDVTAAALRISIENLSGRLPVPNTGDEIARLAGVLNSMLARLETAVKTLSQFAADASHELRTPLAVIRTTAELALRREREPEAYRAALRGVAEEAGRMTALIEDLLALARGDAGAVEMPRAALDLREVLDSVCGELSELARAREIRVRKSLGAEPAVVSGNAAALHRLFLLLLDNALKYSRPGGEVIVAVESGAGQIAAVFEDFGQGIGEADLPHIFERFYQAGEARAAGGHGLGLSLAEAIARAHSASIEVRSRVGEGSTFRVVFPARDTAVQPILRLTELESTRSVL